MTCHSRAPGKNAHPRAPPADFGVRAASTFGLWQPPGSRRPSRGRVFCQYPSTSHVILSQCDVSVRSSCWQCSEFITLTVQWWTMKQFHLFPHQLHWWIWTDCFTGEWRFTGETFSSVIFFVCQWRIANTSLDCNWAYVYCQDQILRKMDRDPYQEWWMWS